MNLSKIKYQLSKAEKELKFWQNVTECYNRYVNRPLPKNHISTIFIAYLLNDSAKSAAINLNNLGIKTPTGKKISAVYITKTIDENKVYDQQLTSIVKRLLKMSRTKAKSFSKSHN